MAPDGQKMAAKCDQWLCDEGMAAGQWRTPAEGERIAAECARPGDPKTTMKVGVGASSACPPWETNAKGVF